MTSSWGNSQQLERRPDIAGAERRLAAACAQIGVAEGGFFPVISLSGSAGYQGQIYSHLFTAPNEIWSVGAGALTPLFEAGKVRAQVRQARAAYDESLAGYRHGTGRTLPVLASPPQLTNRWPMPEPNDHANQIKRYMPWLVAVSLFMENLDATIVNTAVPTMAKALEVTPLSLKGVLTSYTLCLAVFIPISGWMADRFGTRRVFTWAVSLFTLGSLLCGLGMNSHMLVAARVVQGIGGAMMTPVGRLALVRTFPRSEMLAAMNFVVIPALIGPLLGPFVGGMIVHWLPWRTIFFVNLPIGLLGLWLIKRHMPDYRDAAVAPLDRRGFLLFGSGIALLSYVLEIFGEHRLPPGPILVLLALSLSLLTAYYWHGRRIPNPVMRLTLFDVRTFKVAVLGGIITRLGIGGMPFLLPLLYQIGMGFPAWQAGLLTMPQAAAAIAMKAMSKSILARFGHRQVLILNTVCFGCTIMVFSRVGPGTPIWGILLLSFMQGFFSALQFTSMNTLVYADIDDRDASMANSIASTAQMMALSFGVAFASLLAGWFIGQTPQTDTVGFIRALHHTYLALGSVSILSSFIFWRLQPNDGNSVSNRAATPEVAEAA